MKLYLILGLILSSLIGCTTKTSTIDVASKTPIEYSMDQSAALILENDEIKSISIGVYQDGTTVTNYYGEIDPGKGNKANDNSVLEIASVTKTFTAYMTAQAVLDGKLKLDDDIRDYLDGSYDHLEKEGRPILIRDILTHTTGIEREQYSAVLSNMFTINATESEKKALANYNKETFLEDLRKYTLQTKPGEVYDYSGFINPEILAIILEKVYQKPYQKILEEMILNEAGMNHTTMYVDMQNPEHLIHGYTDNNQRVEPTAMPLTGAGGGLTSTVPDMLKYIEFLLSKENAALLGEMKKPLFYDEHEGDEYGYFWMVDGEELMLHNGGTGGQVNWLILLPEMNTGFTISFNYNGENANDLINMLASLLINDLVNYPTKNAYYLIRKSIRTNPSNWQEEYIQLKEQKQDEFNFDDESMLNDLGYELLSEDKTEEAIQVFQLLVSEFPNSANAYDSLAESFYVDQQYDLSITYYKKSLELNPNNTNASAMIQKIEEQQKQ